MNTTLVRTIITTAAVMLLTASLAWGTGCGSGCNEKPENENHEVVPGQAPTDTTNNQPHSREMNISDFVTPGRAVEKDCMGNNCHEPARPQEQPRAPEKDHGCGSNCD